MALLALEPRVARVPLTTRWEAVIAEILSQHGSSNQRKPGDSEVRLCKTTAVVAVAGKAEARGGMGGET